MTVYNMLWLIFSEGKKMPLHSECVASWGIKLKRYWTLLLLIISVGNKYLNSSAFHFSQRGGSTFY